MEDKVRLGRRNDSCKNTLMTKNNESHENSGMLKANI